MEWLKKLFFGSGVPMRPPPDAEAVKAYENYCKDIKSFSWFRVLFFPSPHNKSVSHAILDYANFYGRVFLIYGGLLAGVLLLTTAIPAPKKETEKTKSNNNPKENEEQVSQ